MKRRDFITLLGGAAAWPLVARAQQPERMRRIGVLNSSTERDQVSQAQVAALRDGLAKLGVTWVGVSVPGTSLSQSLEGLERYGASVIAPYRS